MKHYANTIKHNTTENNVSTYYEHVSPNIFTNMRNQKKNYEFSSVIFKVRQLNKKLV